MVLQDTAKTLDETIDELLGQPDAALNAADINWLAEVLGPLYPEFSVAALATKIAKAAVERGDRSVEWKRWDS
jgi:phage gp29-like protein